MNPLCELVGELLTLEGALVEPVAPEGLEVLAPEPLQQALGLPELSRLGFGAELPEGAQRLSLESEWLGRLDGLLGDGGRCLTRVLAPSEATPGDPERLLRHGLSLTNAVFRLQTTAPAWTRYLIFTFRYTAVSDEKREGLIQFGVNTSNGATLDEWIEPLLAVPAAPGPPPPDGALPPAWEAARALALLDRAVPARVHARLAPFVAGMTRRQERDLARLAGYYGGLRAEALGRLEKFQAAAGDADKQRAGVERERGRLETVAREYQAKVADLGQKYAMTVTLEWVQTLALLAPVVRFHLLLQRRKGQRLIHLDWNPQVRRLEQAPCELTGAWDRSRAVCDEQLHLLRPPLLGPCDGCKKEFCRACHRTACPRCGQPWAAATP